MSYPEDQYGGPERRRYSDHEPIEWRWPPRQPQPDDVSPDVEDLLSVLEKDLDVDPSPEDDDAEAERMVLQLQERLSAMGVEDPKSLDIDRFRDIGSLIFAAYSLEDVHYSVYARLKRTDSADYVSVKVNDILTVMPSDDRMPRITSLQTKQTLSSVRYLTALGINPDELRSVTTNGTPDQKFALRCLNRLMREKYLRGMSRDLKRNYNDSWPENTVEFNRVVYDARYAITEAHQRHQEIRPTTTDGKLWHKLEKRALTRALSFANPLVGISHPE